MTCRMRQFLSSPNRTSSGSSTPSCASPLSPVTRMKGPSCSSTASLTLVSSSSASTVRHDSTRSRAPALPSGAASSITTVESSTRETELTSIASCETTGNTDPHIRLVIRLKRCIHLLERQAGLRAQRLPVLLAALCNLRQRLRRRDAHAPRLVPRADCEAVFQQRGTREQIHVLADECRLLQRVDAHRLLLVHQQAAVKLEELVLHEGLAICHSYGTEARRRGAPDHRRVIHAERLELLAQLGSDGRASAGRPQDDWSQVRLQLRSRQLRANLIDTGDRLIAHSRLLDAAKRLERREEAVRLRGGTHEL
eukprot:scaffold54264_cov26-Tisochrysis_lutea.AAC.2